MNALKGFTFTMAPAGGNAITPQEYRRNKLLSNLKEQCEIARCDVDGKEYTPEKKRSYVIENGEKKKVYVDKQVRRWWTTDGDNKIVVMVRWGTSLLALQGDKTGIIINDKSKLVSVFEKLIQAATAKELDAAIEAANKRRLANRKG